MVLARDRSGRVIRYRGTVLESRDLQRIRQLIHRYRDRTRVAIARRVCAHLKWYRLNGDLAEQTCADLLRRLHVRGLIRLPPPRRVFKTRARGSIAELTVSAPWPDLQAGSPFGQGGELEVRPIKPEERQAWRSHVAQHHYLGYRRLVGESLCYVAILNGEVVALIGWGAAALKNSPRDDYIGWDWTTKIQRLQYVVNNVRFLILPWVQEKNLASRILALNLKRLSRDWEARYRHPIYLAETFVDSARFRGTCYRASNWIEVGQTGGWSRQGAGYHHHGQSKATFVYPLHRRALELLRTLDVDERRSNRQEELPLMHLDVTQLPLTGDGGLFDALRKLTEFRKPRGVRHPLLYVLATSACAVLAGMKSFAGIAEWSANQTVEVRNLLGSTRHAPPSKSCVRRVLCGIDGAQMDQVLEEWIGKQTDLKGARLALDGKTLRGSGDGDSPPVHLISAVLHREGIVVAQSRVPSATNEIPCVEPLLADLEIEGAVVTADALHTQKSTANFIVEEKKADYVFTVKENQPTLKSDIESLHLGLFPPSGRNC